MSVHQTLNMEEAKSLAVIPTSYSQNVSCKSQWKLDFSRGDELMNFLIGFLDVALNVNASR